MYDTVVAHACVNNDPSFDLLYFSVKKGDRIAQLICEKIYMPDLEELPVSVDFICSFKLNLQIKKL